MLQVSGRWRACGRTRSPAARTDRQFDLHAAVAAAFADQLVDDDALGRVGERAALAAAALLGGAGLVVDQHRDARRSRAARAAPRRARRGGGRRRPAGSSTPAGYLSGSSVTTTTLRRRPRPRTWRAICGTVSGAVVRLAAGHRDRVVVEDLVGDVDAGGDRLRGSPAARSGSRCRRRGSGTRACVLVNGAWPIQCAPSPPICVKPMVSRSIQLRHEVAADAGQRAASLRAPRWRCCAGSPSRNRACAATLDSRLPRAPLPWPRCSLTRARSMSRSRSVELRDALGDHARDHRRGRARPRPAAASRCGAAPTRPSRRTCR